MGAETRAATAPETNRAGIALISGAHVVDDIYQGVVPAMLPFLVAERHYSYAAVSALVLAATSFSSFTQPLFGWWADRRSRRWLVSVGMVTAGLGVAVAGLTTSYAVTWLALALSGIGVAVFHPEAARAARQAAGSSTRAMSVFAVGGNIGYAVGPLLATPVLLAAGLSGTVWLAVPAVVMGAVLLVWLGPVLDGTAERPRRAVMPSGADDWRSFGWLTGVVITRSVLFFGVTTFLALYLAHSLGASKTVANGALSTFLASGVAGTLFGGWLADRRGKLTSIRLGLALTFPAVLGIVLAPGLPVAMVFVVLAGIGIYLPFSVFVMLGQDYLPQRIGTASGVTVGLAVSIGGLTSPLLGLVADHAGLRTALIVLLVLPAVGLLLSTRLSEPA